MRNPVSLILLFSLVACASPQVQETAAGSQPPELTTSYAVMADGYRLPVSVWETTESPEAMILALHGFNDYQNAFSGPARFFAANRIMTYAYDQRGFGETAQRGLWPGNDVLEADAAAMANLLCDRHPDLPLFLLGESMGGAVLINMQREAPCIKGMVLVGPAVWGWQTMPFWQRYALRFAAHIAPGKTLTGEGLEITASDNVEMLRALWRDPLVIKATRIDSIYGLTNLMESALLSSSQLTTPALILYGEKDEIIPHDPTCMMLSRLPDTATIRFILYPDGYHMLMRDLQADVVLLDTLAWIRNQAAVLPSGHEVTKASSGTGMLCQ
jgi:acylglycerol lipase